MKRLLSSLVLVLSILGGAWGEETPPDVVVALYSTGDRSPLQVFVGNGLVLELTRNEFRATLVQVDGPAPRADDRQAIGRIARSASAPLVLAAVYEVRDREIEITLLAVESEGARVLSTARRTARIDLALDETLIAIVREVVPSMTPVRERQHARFPTKPAAQAAAAPVPAPAPAPGAPGAQPAEPGSGAAPTPGPSLPSPGIRTRPARGWELAVGAAPLVPAGDLAVFLSTGVAVSVRGELQRRQGDSVLGLGLGTGVTLFRAEGPLDSAGGLLAPLVVEGRYGSATGAGTAFYVRGGAGAALFAVDTERVGVLRKFVPCATASLGVSRRMGQRVGIALDATYAVYLDSGDLIMGLAPGVQLLFSR